MYWRYVGRRLFLFIPVMIGVSLLVFGLIHLAPGDPVVVILGSEYNPQAAAQLRQHLGLDQPLWVQYGVWLVRIARGDLGQSLFAHLPVAGLILQSLPLTLQLALSGMAVAISIGLPAGVLAATRPNTIWDHIGRITAMI